MTSDIACRSRIWTRTLLALLAVPALALSFAPALAQSDPHAGHGAMEAMPGMAMPISAGPKHGASHHSVGPAGATYDLRFLDAMVQHHTGALRMSELVFDIGQPGVGALAKRIWGEQAQEIRAMGLWRKAWYPQAPVYPVALAPGGDPDSLDGLIRMDQAQIEAMRMLAAGPSQQNRVEWFLEGMLHHHGGALVMAHEALARSRNPTIRRFARNVIVAQRAEIIELRRMLATAGWSKPAYSNYDALFAL